ncbi:DUF2207 domain-containing protein [Clostridia bacterium]|nr:DUF2207 domain-containing protein [Clostridia bacterium]
MLKSASKLILVFLSILFMLFTAPVAAMAEYFDIANYDVTVQVNSDYSYDVVEKLAVDFSEPRHGIYREIPLDFADRPVRIKNISVEGGDTDISSENGSKIIRIGNSEDFVDGRQDYEIRYTLILGADTDAEADLFYLNIIGTEWDVPIHKASFTVNMPAPYDFSNLTITSGYLGSEETSNVQFQQTDQGFTGKTLSSLEPGQGLTAYLVLPEGYFADVKGPATWPKLAILLMGALLTVLAYRIWDLKGRDSEVIITPEFYPPDNMTPAEAGYIIDRAVQPTDVTSLILYWAEKGYLEMEEDGKNHFRLFKMKELPQKGVQHYEHYFFNALFNKGSGNQVSTKDLKGDFYEEMATAQGMIKSSFTDNAERRITNRSSDGYRFLLVVFSLLPLWGMVAYSIYLLNAGYISISSALLSGLPTLAPIIGIALLSNGFINRKINPRSKTAGLMIGGFVFLGGSIVAYLVLTQMANIFLYGLLALLFTLGIGFLGQATEKRTPYGTRILGLVLGYKQFLKTAEKDRIERLLEENPNYFYDTLPYAQVLGVTKKWAKKFEGLTMEPPHYYRGDSGLFNAVVFASVMDRSFSSVSKEMAVNPNANSGGSGMGGGGFSGGGAGGGGGGSW